MPEILVRERARTSLAEHGYDAVEEVRDAEESLLFALPPELRRDLQGRRRGSDALTRPPT